MSFAWGELVGVTGGYCDDVWTPMNIGLGILVEAVAFVAAA